MEQVRRLIEKIKPTGRTGGLYFPVKNLKS
jgi:hypothetical protein